MKKSILIVALAIFLLTSATALANNYEGDCSICNDQCSGNDQCLGNKQCSGDDQCLGNGQCSICKVNFTDKDVYVLDHSSSPSEGNWITLSSSGERSIQLPSPMKLTYSGPNSIEYRGATGQLSEDSDGSYTVSYPSTSLYLTHPIYLPGENVSMSFHGDSDLEGDVEIYLFNLTSDSAYGFYDAFKAGEFSNFNNTFHNNMDGKYKIYSATLDENGDILDYNFGPFDSGQYCIAVIQKNENGNLTFFSSTAFFVAEYELSISAPESILNGNNLDINMNLEGASDEGNCTYGAILINEDAYRADVNISSNGTRNGTDITVNDVDIIDEFGINSSNYRSKIDRNEIQKDIQILIGEGNGSLSVGEKGQDTLSITAFDLPNGHYYLLVAAYIPGKGLVGLNQIEVDIKATNDSEDDGSGDSGSGDDDSGDSGSEDDDSGDDDSGDDDSGDDDSGDDDSGDSGSGSGGSGSDGSGSSGSGSSGSSGTGGSPESAKNIKSKELCQQYISSGKIIKFEFKKGATCVNYVMFKAKKTVGKTTAIVEELKGKSSLTSTEPEGEIYKYVNIWIGNSGFANSNNIENATVGFKVSKEWINNNHINTKSFVLQHYSNKKWNALPTKQIDEDDEYIYFEAETPSFSPFAITAEKNKVVIEDESGESQETSELGSQEETGSVDEDATTSQEDKSHTFSKVATFFVGLVVILIIGLIIMKKKEPEN